MLCVSVNDGQAVSSGAGLSSYWAFTNTTTTCEETTSTVEIPSSTVLNVSEQNSGSIVLGLALLLCGFFFALGYNSIYDS
jgi:hypothetical protein